MAITLSKWDVVAHLRCDEDIACYFDACLAEHDSELLVAALHDIARAWNLASLAIKFDPESGLFEGSFPGKSDLHVQGETLADLRTKIQKMQAQCDFSGKHEEIHLGQQGEERA